MPIADDAQNRTLGLLALLNVKNRGRNPSVLLETISPSVDLLRVYLNDTAEMETNSAAVGGSGFGLLLQVPNDEIWYVHSAHVIFSSVLLGEACFGVAAVLDNGGAAVARLADAPSFDVGILAAGHMPGNSLRDFWALPGDRLGFWMYQGNTATPATGTIWCRCTKLKI